MLFRDFGPGGGTVAAKSLDSHDLEPAVFRETGRVFIGDWPVECQHGDALDVAVTPPLLSWVDIISSSTGSSSAVDSLNEIDGSFSCLGECSIPVGIPFSLLFALNPGPFSFSHTPERAWIIWRLRPPVAQPGTSRQPAQHRITGSGGLRCGRRVSAPPTKKGAVLETVNRLFVRLFPGRTQADAALC